MKPTVVGQSALVFGPKYDLEKVLAAYERLVDAVAGRFGGTWVTTARPEAQRRFPWPDPGKDLSRRIWTRLREIHDVVDESLLHPMDGFALKAYLLGKTWCVQQPGGAVTTPEGGSLSAFDPVPMVCVYGPLQDDGSHRLVARDVMDEIARVVAGPLVRDLRLGFERETADAGAAVAAPADYAFITFPHEVYGAGRDWLNVRCVSVDGGDPKPDGAQN